MFVAPVGKSRRLFRQAEQPNLTLDEIDAAKRKQVITGSRWIRLTSAAASGSTPDD
jgi:hypothetical protein